MNTTVDKTPLKVNTYKDNEDTSERDRDLNSSVASTILERKLSRIQEQIAENNKQLSKQRQEFLNKSTYQSREIKKLQNIVTMSFSTNSESPFVLQKDISAIEHKTYGDTTPTRYRRGIDNLFSTTLQPQAYSTTLRNKGQSQSAQIRSLNNSGMRFTK